MMMVPRRIYKNLVIIFLATLIITLAPGLANVWAEVEQNSSKTNLGSQPLSPLAQEEETVVRAPASLDDMIVQFGAGSEEKISTQSDNSGVEVVPGAAFIHTNELGAGTEGEDWLFYFDGGYLRNDSNNEVCLVAPVYLPPNARIDSFTVYVVDNFGSDNVTFYLDRTSLGGDWTELGRVQSTGSSTAIQALTDPSITPTAGADIVTPGFNYQVAFCFPASSFTSIRVNAAQVNYTVNAAPNASQVYLPILSKSSITPIFTSLTVQNNTGGTLYSYQILNTPQGTITCPGNIPDGESRSCGSFFSGVYEAAGDTAACGAGKAQVVFPEGNCTRIVTCGRDPSTMVCN